MNNSSTMSSGLPRTQAIVWCATFILESVVIIMGNAITIAIFSTARKRNKQRSYLLMINLAVADVLIGALPLPLYVYHAGIHPLKLWAETQNTALAIIFSGLDIFLGFASLLTLTAISIERFYASSFPVKYKGAQLNAYIVTIVSIWGLALVTGTFCVAGMNLLSYGRMVATYVSMSLISVLCLIICVSYIQIWVALKRRRQQLHHKSKDLDSRLAITLLIVTFSSLAAWLPFVIVNFCYMVSPFHLQEELLLLSKLLHYGNSVLNPIIYSFRVPGFRTAVKRILSLSTPQDHRNTRKGAMSIDNASRDASHSPTFSLRESRTV